MTNWTMTISPIKVPEVHIMDGIVFNTIELDRFWRFVHERHSIWHRRFILRLPQDEWTDDEVLKKNKFTNIYRELDPGTRYAIDNILIRDDPRPDVVFNVMLYRLMCSIPTYDGYGFQRLDDFDAKDFEVYLGEIYESGRPVFGNAYLISPYSSMGSEYKYINVARLFGQLHRGFDEFWDRLNSAPTFEKAYGVIAKQYGFGPFLAYQILVDLTYTIVQNKYRSAILPLNQNEWVRLGPGALRGYSRVTKSPYHVVVLKWLREHQETEFLRVRVDFPFLRDSVDLKVKLSLPNLQNCFCEFHKYRSIQDGVGKAQRLFVPSSSTSRQGGIS